ncbi:MAG: hypothetical protein JJU21_13210 [Salinarimonas sp.]|nr:hypothetical protein [Salinarimonas sp.]
MDRFECVFIHFDVSSDLFIDAFQAAGARPTAMARGEVFTPVQQGAVDGLEIPRTLHSTPGRQGNGLAQGHLSLLPLEEVAFSFDLC